jgi:tetratricopeptide (TPR) repeat protein
MPPAFRPSFASLWLAVATAGLTVGMTSGAHAADTPEPAPVQRTASDPLASARAHLAAQRWQPAIADLKKANASGDADWNNLMGYALRKQATPDLEGAQRHYDAALRINPAHLGALEYSGELALMKGDLPTAEGRLAALAKLCSSPCEALDDLKQAIARYKATGKP